MNFLTLVNGFRTFVSRVDFIDIANGSFRIRLTGTATADRQVDLPNDTGTVLLDDRPVGSLNAGVSLRGYEPIVNVTTNKTLALTDAGTTQVITGSGSAIITIPLNSSVAFPIGTRIVVVKGTTGAVAVSWGAGLTINIEGSLYTAASNASVYTYAVLRKIATNTWSFSAPIAINQLLPGTPTVATQVAGDSSLAIANTSFVQTAIANVRSVVSVRRNTVLSVAHNTNATIPLNTVDIDTDSMFNSGTGAVVISSGRGGVYSITAMASINPVQQFYVRILINGPISAQSPILLSGTDNVSGGEVTRILRLNAGDTVSLGCFQINSTSAAKDLYFTGAFQACLQMTRIGP